MLAGVVSCLMQLYLRKGDIKKVCIYYIAGVPGEGTLTPLLSVFRDAKSYAMLVVWVHSSCSSL